MTAPRERRHPRVAGRASGPSGTGATGSCRSETTTVAGRGQTAGGSASSPRRRPVVLTHTRDRAGGSACERPHPQVGIRRRRHHPGRGVASTKRRYMSRTSGCHWPRRTWPQLSPWQSRPACDRRQRRVRHPGALARWPSPPPRRTGRKDVREPEQRLQATPRIHLDRLTQHFDLDHLGGPASDTPTTAARVFGVDTGRHLDHAPVAPNQSGRSFLPSLFRHRSAGTGRGML